MARYADKVVIVTGGSKGVGRGIVTAFVENGAKVVFCARGSAAGEALEAELNPKGPGCCTFLSDMNKEDDIQAKCVADFQLVMSEIISKETRLFHRRALWTHRLSGEQRRLASSAQSHRRHQRSGIQGPAQPEPCQLLPRLQTGSAVPASAPGEHHKHVQFGWQKDAVPYVATKGAIISLTKAMAVDESRYSVRVNCLSPGNVMTPLWEELASHTPDTEAAIREGQNSQLLGRMGTEAEGGAAALFLAADASFCTGIELLLSGGAELNYGFKNQCLVPAC